MRFSLRPVLMKKLDLIIWGATGFTGQLVATYLAEKPTIFTMGLAGRNLEKLENLKKKLMAIHPAHKEIPLFVAQSDDEESLKQLVISTKVIINMVGPYMIHAEPLIALCVEHQTDYVDITGETVFIREMIQKFHSKAQKNKTLIIPSCGVESLPFDLGVFLLASKLKEQGLELGLTRTHCIKGRGGVSGGTFASFSNMIASGRLNEMNDAYCLTEKGISFLNSF